MSRSLRSIGSLIILATVITAVAGTFLFVANAAQTGPADDVRITSARDFLFAYQPQSPVGDSVVITAQLFKNGQPLKQAGVPVYFSLSDGRFATLDDSTAYTDQWGMATTHVRSHDSGQAMTEKPFLLVVSASAAGKSAQLTLPITHYMSLNGTVKNKSGDPVQGASVVVLYNATHNSVNAMGATSTTDIDGKYRLERVPTDLGNMIVYARKGDLETYMPANFPQGS